MATGNNSDKMIDGIRKVDMTDRNTTRLDQPLDQDLRHYINEKQSKVDEFYSNVFGRHFSGKEQSKDPADDNRDNKNTDVNNEPETGTTQGNFKR